MGPAKGRHCSMLSHQQIQGFAHSWKWVHLELQWKILGSALGWEWGKRQGGLVVRVAPRCLPGSAGIVRCLLSLGWEVGWVLVSESPCLLPEVLPAVGLTLAGGGLRQHVALGRKCP